MEQRASQQNPKPKSRPSNKNEEMATPSTSNSEKFGHNNNNEKQLESPELTQVRNQIKYNKKLASKTKKNFVKKKNLEKKIIKNSLNFKKYLEFLLV